MRHFLSNLVSCIFSLVKFSFIKLFHFRTFFFHPLVRFSPNVRVGISAGSDLKIGRKVIVRSGSKIVSTGGGKLTIGSSSGFGYYCIVICRHCVTIGKNVYFGPNTLIYDHDHDFRDKEGIRSKKYKCAPIEIGDGTWIGANCVILKGATVGKNCVIGAGSIVKGNIPDNTVFVQKRDTVMFPVMNYGE